MKKLSIFLLLILSAGYLEQARAASLKGTVLNIDTILNKPAPDFHLKDVNGKTVSLSDYKGKTLIIDFWATWCKPCLMSFPSIASVMDKYKDNPNVKFLFIDVREKGEDYPEKVKGFLKESGYPFDVVYDEKGADGAMNKTLKSYTLAPGIPEKFIIDGKGMMRFETWGINPDKSKEQLVNELINEIETVRKQN